MIDSPSRLTAALADRYRIERELGEGGMATVYLAHDLRHDRKVALKVLKPELAMAVGGDRFLREIRIAANLSHPHIVPLFDSGEVGTGSGGHGTFLYYVMPYLEGESLGARLRRGGALPVEEAVRVLREVADALAFAHQRGIVHRDIKPENVMLTGGHAVVTDFGVAKAVTESARDGGLTTAGMAVGTPAYMAPEQVAADPATDHRADIYALGTLAYELLAGRTPFTGLTPQGFLAAQIAKEPDPLSAHRRDCPASLETMVMRCLAKEPAQRWQTAAEIRAECDRMTRTSGDHAPLTPERTALGIVVLPFVNQSADAENEYFSDGLTEELITDLAKVKALRVISRTSSMQLKGTTKGIHAIGRELGVDHVLEGSVRKAGNALRITAQLIDARTDTPLWSEKYTGTVEDVFDLQERVSRAIVEALDLTLSPDESKRLTDRPIRDVRAFELYLQARQELRRYNLDRGSQLLGQAMAIEGEAPVLRALRGYADVIRLRIGIDREEALRRAEAEARALIQMAPDAPYGHALLAQVHYERGEQAEAVRAGSAALALDPNDAEVLFYLGISLVAAGQNQRAAETSAALLAADPLSPFAPMLAGISNWFVGRAEQALPSMERARDLEPDSIIIHWSLGYHYAYLGRVAEAAAEAEWMQRHAAGMPYTVQLRALVAALEGRQDEALAWLRQVDTAPLDAHNIFHLGESFAMAGNTGAALALFERAVDGGFFPHEFYAIHCPFLQPLRGTPEFERVLAKAARRVAEFSA
jgi:serine/threonine protein kinase/tetratricopeptide (TPR) repeat protein